MSQGDKICSNKWESKGDSQTRTVYDTLVFKKNLKRIEVL